MAQTTPNITPRYTLHHIFIPDDYATLTDLSIAAMKSNPLHYLVYPAQPASQLERAIWEFQLESKIRHEDEGKGFRTVKIVDGGFDFGRADGVVDLNGDADEKGGGQIVGFASWALEQASDKRHVETVMRPVGEGVDFSLIDEFRRLTGPLFTKHFRPETDIVLHLMRVHPAYQKQGLGKMLLDWGLQQAREKGKRVVLLASPAGRRLYEKNGFVVLEEVKLDLARFGGEGEYTPSLMVWEGER